MTDLDALAREIAVEIVRNASPVGLCDCCIDDIAAALLRARNEGIEEAAEVADKRGEICRDAHETGQGLRNEELHCALEAEHIATAIRALKTKGE